MAIRANVAEDDLSKPVLFIWFDVRIDTRIRHGFRRASENNPLSLGQKIGQRKWLFKPFFTAQPDAGPPILRKRMNDCELVILEHQNKRKMPCRKTDLGRFNKPDAKAHMTGHRSDFCIIVGVEISSCRKLGALNGYRHTIMLCHQFERF